jgi:hypothetical protein
MACFNERPSLGKAPLTGVDPKPMYQSRWYHRIKRRTLLRDRHCRSDISSVLTKIEATNVDGITTEETRFQRETEIEEGTSQW